VGERVEGGVFTALSVKT